MKYCPHCRKPTLQTDGECPHCGHDLGQSGAAAEDPEPSYDQMSGFEEEDESSSLELDIAPPSARFTPAPQSALDLDGGSYPSAQPSQVPGAPDDGAPPPTPPPRPTGLEAAPLPDQFEIDEVAGYGAAPSSVLHAPAYALKVRKRSAELENEVARLRRELDTASEERQDALAKLGERARVAGYGSADVTPLLSLVQTAEQQVAGAADVAAGEQERHQARIAEIQTDIERVNARMSGPRATEASLAGQLTAREEERRRASTQLQQAEALLQQAQSAIAKAGNTAEGQQQDPAVAAQAAQYQAQLPAIHAQGEQLRTTMAQLDGPIAELRTELQSVREELDRLDGERKGHNELRAEERKRHDDAMRQAASQSDEASKDVRDKLATVGELVRLEGPSHSWAQELFGSIDERTARLNGASKDYALYEAAATAYDEGAVKQGYLIMGVGAALVVLGGLGLIILSSVL